MRPSSFFRDELETTRHSLWLPNLSIVRRPESGVIAAIAAFRLTFYICVNWRCARAAERYQGQLHCSLRITRHSIMAISQYCRKCLEEPFALGKESRRPHKGATGRTPEVDAAFTLALGQSLCLPSFPGAMPRASGKRRIIGMPAFEVDYSDRLEPVYILSEDTGSGNIALGCCTGYIWQRAAPRKRSSTSS